MHHLYMKFIFKISEDVTIQVFEQARDDDYKVALQGQFLDLRTILFKEEENDKKIGDNDKSES